MTGDFIQEKVIEDIIGADKSILAEILSVSPSSLDLISRQKPLPSGRLDLLYLCEDDLLLIELKAVPFYDAILDQINGYYYDLVELQQQHKLITAQIRKIVLVTAFTPEDAVKCVSASIRLLLYKPQSVLSKYYENFKEISAFLNVRSNDYGVVRLGLLNSTLCLLAQDKSIDAICAAEGRSEKTIRNRLSIGISLGLVVGRKRDYILTDFGNEIVMADAGSSRDNFSEHQIELLSNFVRRNPFLSSTTYSVFSMLETIFVLAKSMYPVPFPSVEDYFVKSVGKQQTWKTPKARTTATYIFSNYACELLFTAKIDNHFYITPNGLQAVLLLQLNRSISLIESQNSSANH